MDRIVELGPKNVTGADYYGVCSNAWMLAVRRLINSCKTHRSTPVKFTDLQILGDNKELKAEDVVVTMKDFKDAMKDLKSSVKPEDLLYFEKLNQELSIKKQVSINK